MKTILLPFHDDDAAEAALATAHLVATRFGSYLEGLLVRRTPVIVAGEGIALPAESLTQLASDEDRIAEAGRRFTKFTDAKGIPYREVTFTREKVTAGWRDVEGQEGEIVGEYGRLFDLVVIARIGPRGGADWQATCEAALFESGRPVLIAPTAAPQGLGDTVVIAWNGSTETARAVALGMPFLSQAVSVLVLTVENGTVPGPSGEQMANHLVRNGINATARTISPGDLSVGEAVLAEAKNVGADLLIKGAYTQHRLRQMIFGGATRHILTHAELPVLMAH